MDQTAADDLTPLGLAPLASRRAVVDLGSNSVRLVIYEGENRNPVQIFNEKAVLRLARGMTSTGQLDPRAMEQAETVLCRYAAIARAMGAAPFEVLATSAVRDAENGPEFVRLLMERLPDLRISVLSGHQEAALSAEGVLCGIPGADGVLADLGGGSLELVRLDAGRVAQTATLPVGVIRLADSAGADLVRARAIVTAALDQTPFIAEAAGRDLYLAGGAFRALARIHIAQTGYPLNMVHHYTIGREGSARPGRGDRRGRAQADRADAGRAAPPDRGFAVCGADPAAAAAHLWRCPRGVLRQWAAGGLVRPAVAGGGAGGGPAAGGRAGPDAWHAAGRGAAGGADRLDQPAVPGSHRSATPAAGGGLLALRHRQPRAPGVPRRAGVLAGAAPARHRPRPSRKGFFGANHRAAL